MDLKSAVKKIVIEALAEGHGSDPIVDNAADVLVNQLLLAMESSYFGDEQNIASVATELMVGAPEGAPHDKLTLARYEDVDATAELIVQAVFRDPQLHDELHSIASAMLRSAMRAGPVDEAHEPSSYDYDGSDMSLDQKRSAAAEKARRQDGAHGKCQECGKLRNDCECPKSESSLAAAITSIVKEMKLGVAGRGYFDFGGGEEADDVSHLLLRKDKPSEAPKAPESGVQKKKPKKAPKKQS